MAGQEDFFTPEHIDNQVEELLQKRSPSAQDLYFARDLRSLLSSSAEDAHSLERVLSRLLQENEHYSAQKITVFSEVRAHQKTHHKRIYDMPHQVKTQQSLRRGLSVFAAALTVAVLVGSMLFIFTNMHRRPANTPPSTSGTGKVSSTVQVHPGGPIGKIVYHAPPEGAVISTLRWSPDGSRVAALFATGGTSQQVRSWDAFSGKKVVSYAVPGTGYAIETLNWSSDGTLLSISDRQSGSLYLFNARTGALKAALRISANSSFYQQPPTPTPTGPIGNQGNRSTTFFSSTFSLSAGPGPSFRSQAWSHDDRYLAAAYTNTSDPVHSVDAVYVWDTASGSLVKTLTDFRGANNLVWSPDDRLLGAAALLPQYPGEGAIPMVLHVKFWDTTTWKLVTQHQFFNNVYTFTWSPDARQIALSDGAYGAYPDHGVKIMDAMTGQTLKQFAQRESNITDLAWSPNGKQLALNSDSWKASVELWNVTNGTLFYSFSQVRAYDVAWAPNSKYIACQEAGPSNGEVLVWIAG